MYFIMVQTRTDSKIEDERELEMRIEDFLTMMPFVALFLLEDKFLTQIIDIRQ